MFMSGHNSSIAFNVASNDSRSDSNSGPYVGDRPRTSVSPVRRAWAASVAARHVRYGTKGAHAAGGAVADGARYRKRGARGRRGHNNTRGRLLVVRRCLPRDQERRARAREVPRPGSQQGAGQTACLATRRYAARWLHRRESGPGVRPLVRAVTGGRSSTLSRYGHKSANWSAASASVSGSGIVHSSWGTTRAPERTTHTISARCGWPGRKL